MNCLPGVRGLMIDIATPQTSGWIHGRSCRGAPCGRPSAAGVQGRVTVVTTMSSHAARGVAHTLAAGT
jgi:hypothetical protein